MLPYTTGPEVEQYYRHFALFLNNIMYLMILVFNFWAHTVLSHLYLKPNKTSVIIYLASWS